MGGMDVKKHANIIKEYQSAEITKRRENSAERRVKIHVRSVDNKYYKKNFTDLKNIFRKKQLVVPYKHPEMDKLPFEKLDEESAIKFEPEKLPRKQ